MAEIKHGSITVLLINNYCAIVFIIPDQIIGLFITQSLWWAFERLGCLITPPYRGTVLLFTLAPFFQEFDKNRDHPLLMA